MEQLFRRIDERLHGDSRRAHGCARALCADDAAIAGTTAFASQGRPEPGPKEDTGAGWARVMPGFFETIGAKIVLGRPFTEDDTAATRNVAVVNEAFVQRFFKDQNPIGQHFGPNRHPIRRDIRNRRRGQRHALHDLGLQGAGRPDVLAVRRRRRRKYDDPDFNSGENWSHYLYNIVIWAPGDPPGMEQKVRKALASIDPNLVVYDVNPYSKVVSADFQQQNMIATLTTLFGLLGLVLAAVGFTA